MDKSIITHELQILLEAINEQFEIIREYEGFIPQIEFDMIMENIRKLYETFHRLQRLNDPMLFVGKKISELREIRNPVPAPLSHNDIKPGNNQEKNEHIINAESFIEQEKQLVPEPVMKPAHSPVADPSREIHTESSGTAEPHINQAIPISPAPGKEMQRKRPSKTAELELFPSEEPVFNIKLKEAREKSLGPRISRHDSFKAAIGINDKFLFINDLFDGNLREYNESIETLGGFKTLPQAQEYLDLLRRRNNWNSASDAFRRIKEIVEKRY